MRRFQNVGAAIFGAALITTTVLMGSSALAQKVYGDYKVPKNEFGQPDLGGNWSNASLTPLTRPPELGDQLVYTKEQVAVIEGQAKTILEEDSQPTDPDAPAEFEHERSVTNPAFESAGGDVGGYNVFWLDPGQHVMRVGGEPRTSILTTRNGQPPKRLDGTSVSQRYGSNNGREVPSYETRSLGERCIIGFGRNGGPPMLANGFYNNNYQIVQAPDHVMILVEMIHDARIIRLNDKHRDDGVRPWFGDSIGWYEGNTLVVETTNIPEKQEFFGSWENLKVTERFTRVAENRLHYAFTVEDPTTWAEPWGGEYEFSPLDGEIYEYACHEGNYALPGILRGIGMEQEKKN